MSDDKKFLGFEVDVEKTETSRHGEGQLAEVAGDRRHRCVARSSLGSDCPGWLAL
jgi:hypothetical protein